MVDARDAGGDEAGHLVGDGAHEFGQLLHADALLAAAAHQGGLNKWSKETFVLYLACFVSKT